MGKKFGRGPESRQYTAGNMLTQSVNPTNMWRNNFDRGLESRYCMEGSLAVARMLPSWWLCRRVFGVPGWEMPGLRALKL